MKNYKHIDEWTDEKFNRWANDFKDIRYESNYAVCLADPIIYKEVMSYFNYMSKRFENVECLIECHKGWDYIIQFKDPKIALAWCNTKLNRKVSFKVQVKAEGIGCRYHKIGFYENPELYKKLNHGRNPVGPKLFNVESGKNSSKKTIKRSVSNRTRFLVFKKYRYRCAICGSSSADGIRLEIDHIRPVSKGGSNNIDNLQVLCFNCNRGKSNLFM